MKQLFRMLWDGSTQELVVVGGILVTVLSILFPSWGPTLREVLAAVGGTAVVGGAAADAHVRASENHAAASVQAAQVTAKAPHPSAPAPAQEPAGGLHDVMDLLHHFMPSATGPIPPQPAGVTTPAAPVAVQVVAPPMSPGDNIVPGVQG